jgi:hypothetical protein
MAAKDYGVRRAGGHPIVIACGVGAAVLVGIYLATQLPYSHKAEGAEQAAWTVVGPPCPTLSAADYQALGVKPQPFDFENIHGDSENTDATCNVVDLDHHGHTASTTICQLTAPFAVHMKTPNGDFYFKPGVGKPVAVSIAEGEVSCTIGGKEHAPGEL